MQARSSLTALVLTAAFAGHAVAETPTVVDGSFQSGRSRAEVLAELAAFRQAGVNPWSISYNPLRDFRSAATPAEVRMSFLAAREQVRAQHAEDGGSNYSGLTQLAGGGAPVAAGTALAGGRLE